MISQKPHLHHSARMQCFLDFQIRSGAWMEGRELGVAQD